MGFLKKSTDPPNMMAYPIFSCSFSLPSGSFLVFFASEATNKEASLTSMESVPPKAVINVSILGSKWSATWQLGGRWFLNP